MTNRPIGKKIAALILAAGCATVTAFASPLDVALPYNFFVLHNYNSGADLTGRIAAGGTISAGITVGTDIGLATDPYTLAAFPISVYAAAGMVGGGSSNVQKGNEFVGTGTGTFNQNGGGHIQASCTPNCIDFQAAATSLVSYSAQLAGLTANGTVGAATDPANPSFTALVGNNAKLNIFNISAATFQTQTLDIRVPAGSTTIVNVSGNVTGSGGSLVINGTQFAGTQANGAGILFNFSGATSVNINQQFSASILAPSAVFSSSSQIDGNIIVSSVTSSGETHDALFTGGNNLPAANVTAPTPEPVSFLTLGGGLMALAFVGRGRKARR